MMKATTMDAVMSYEHLDGEGTIIDEVLSEEGLESLLNMGSTNEEETYSLVLPKVQIVVGTKALQCGVSGNHIKHAFKKGFPASMYELVQELGRVDRRRNAEPGTNTYEIHISFDSYISIFVRIMKNTDADERKVQLRQLHEVLEFLLVPSTCYHTTIENYFERRIEGEKCDCEKYCTFCREEHDDFTGKVHKKGLLHVLLTKVFSSSKAPTCAEVIKVLKSGKEKIFHADNVPSRNTGPIHGLVLQLLAKRIIGLTVSDTTKVGTDKLMKRHLIARLLNSDDDGMSMPSYLMDNAFSGMNIM